MAKRRAVLVAMGAAISLALGVWALPLLVRSLRGPSATSLVSSGPARDEVDQFVDAAIKSFGGLIVAEQEDEELVTRVVKLPAGISAVALGEVLRRDAAAAGVEVYTSVVDGLDLDVRVYAGATLRHQLVLSPTIPSDPIAPVAENRRTRPRIALVVAGVGATDASIAIRSRVPLTLAIRPFEPQSLRAAHAAAMAGLEVIVDLSATASAPAAPRGATAADMRAARDAVPFNSGLLADQAPPAGVLGDLDVLVMPAGAPGDAPPRSLFALHSQRRGAGELLLRARTMAIEGGHAALVVDIADPGLAGVLQWASSADASGYRLVFATEASRPEDTRGTNETPPAWYLARQAAADRISDPLTATIVDAPITPSVDPMRDALSAP
jgi:hypothetical protein